MALTSVLLVLPRAAGDKSKGATLGGGLESRLGLFGQGVPNGMLDWGTGSSEPFFDLAFFRLVSPPGSSHTSTKFGFGRAGFLLPNFLRNEFWRLDFLSRMGFIVLLIIGFLWLVILSLTQLS